VQRLQREEEIARVLKALRGVFLEATRDHLVQRRRRARHRLHRVGVEDRVPTLDRRLPGERHLPAQALRENRPQREHVAARVGRPPPHLLGRHVAGGAHHRALGRHRQRAGRRRARRLERARHAEVENLEVPVFREEQVLGLEIAVHDALLVHGGQPEGDLHAHLDRLARRQRALRQPFPQRLAHQQLGHQVRRVALAAHVEHREHVGVVERRSRPRLRLEPLEPRGIRRRLGRQHLDRHLAAESRIARAEHHAHAARTERRNDVIRAEPLTRSGHQRESKV